MLVSLDCTLGLNLQTCPVLRFAFGSVDVNSGTLQFFTLENRVTLTVGGYTGNVVVYNPSSSLPNGPYTLTLSDMQGHSLTVTVQVATARMGYAHNDANVRRG